MRTILVALLAATLLAGCGGKADGSSESGFKVPPQDDSGRYLITLTPEYAFEPAKARIPQGAIVAFQAELEGCDVRSEEAGGPDSHSSQYGNGLIPKNGEYSWFAPDSEGEFHILCTLHEGKGMTGTLRIA